MPLPLTRPAGHPPPWTSHPRRPLNLAALLLSACAPSTGDPARAATPAATENPAWACELGPKVGQAILQPQLVPGRYDLEAHYGVSALPTMERTYDHHYEGRAWIDLAAAGAFEACLGVAETSASSVSKYASQDGEHHSSSSQNRTLLHLRGRWEQRADGVRLTVTHESWGECTAAPEAMTPYSTTTLVCGLLPAAPPLPVPTLACRAMGQTSYVDNLGLELGASSRAGAWQLRFPPVPSAEVDGALPCGPWLLLGAAPGLVVRSEEGRQDREPKLSFTAGVAAMDPGQYVQRPTP